MAIIKGAGIVYTDAIPTHTPEAGTHSEVALDINTFTLYIYDRDDAEWKFAARAGSMPTNIYGPYVDDDEAIADGRVAGDLYTVAAGNDAIPEGVIKIVQ